MDYYLGIDIGNTKTQYTLANEIGCIIGNHVGSGTNHQDIGQEEVFKRLNSGIEALLLKIGNISKDDISFAYFGACGADTPDEFVMLRKLFKNLLGSVPFDFDNDGIIALKNGVELDSGIVVTCGTGNTNFAVNDKGEFGRIGGLADHLGDNLGAAVIARKATYAATRSMDERDFPSILPRRICEALELNEIFDLINYDELDADMVKKINQTFFAVAEEGDGKALELVWEFTKEIIRIMEYFLLRMFSKDKKFRLALDGPVFKSDYKPFMKMINLAVKERYPNAEIVVPEYPPVLGALYFAFEKSNKLTSKIIEKLKQSYTDQEG
jgi:N-acetylglucosamine kinase-like BadF-type ATPase